MIVFSPLSTRRLDVRLRELSLDDEMALCYLPERMYEKALTEFLVRAIEHAGTPSERHVADPRAWTASERLLAFVHYSLHTREDAPDFAVTEAGRLSDFLDMARDSVHRPTWEVGEDKWTLQPLTGAMAETIEALQLELSPDQNGFKHWLVGLIAAQGVRANENAAPDPIASASDYTDWLRLRMKVIGAMPTSYTQELYAKFRDALGTSTDFFRLWFDDKGVIVLPKEAGSALNPARFLIYASISELALSLAGKS